MRRYFFVESLDLAHVGIEESRRILFVPDMAYQFQAVHADELDPAIRQKAVRESHARCIEGHHQLRQIQDRETIFVWMPALVYPIRTVLTRISNSRQ